VLGHEGAGTVVEVGAKVNGFKVGDRVVATFGSCGNCPNCSSNRPAYCFDGIALNIEGKRCVDRPSITKRDGSAIGGTFFQQSSFASHALVTERNLVRIPSGLDMVTAAPLGCGFLTGAGAVFNQIDAAEQRPLLVIGAGAVGLAAVMAGKIAGCSPIIVVESNAARRQLAIKVGATHGFDSAETDWVAKVVDLTGGGATAALDTAGKQATFEAALSALHPGGTLGVLTLPGNFSDPVQHPGGLDFLTKKLVGVVEGDAEPSKLIPRLIAYYSAGQLPIDRMTTNFKFSDIAAAFQAVMEQRVVKAVLTFEEENQ
jgi:aryl-alcohol dehydrogenase